MNVERLRQLVNVLRHEVDPAKFNMETWMCKNGAKAQRHCGTVGCAVGWGITLIPEWQAAGFTLAIPPHEAMLMPMYKGRSNFSAAGEFFDIGYNNAVWLFSPGAYYRLGRTGKISQNEVADRIDAFIAKNGR